MFEVLKSFKYSPDGIKVLNFEKSDIIKIKDDLVDPLIREGYIRVSKKIEAPGIKLETKPMPKKTRAK